MNFALTKEMMAALAQVEPWTWIALLYGAQVLGAAGTAAVFGLESRQMTLPIALLIMGTLHAVVVRSSGGRVGPRMLHHWVPATIYCLFIYSLSNESFSGADVGINVNFFHPVEYAFLAIFFCWMGHAMIPSRGAAPLIRRVLAGGMAFAVSDEIHQSFIPGRMPSCIDLLLDFIGLSLGCSIFFAGRRFRQSCSVRAMGDEPIA